MMHAMQTFEHAQERSWKDLRMNQREERWACTVFFTIGIVESFITESVAESSVGGGEVREVGNRRFLKETVFPLPLTPVSIDAGVGR